MGLNEPPKHNEGSAMTQRTAILKALTGGKAMRKSEIVKKASEIYAKSIKAINVAFHLAALKKEKIIVSPKQGWYKLAK
jgi:hypothetical protein